MGKITLCATMVEHLKRLIYKPSIIITRLAPCHRDCLLFSFAKMWEHNNHPSHAFRAIVFQLTPVREPKKHATDPVSHPWIEQKSSQLVISDDEVQIIVRILLQSHREIPLIFDSSRRMSKLRNFFPILF